jgi:tryptophan-rich hypothetical protein
VLDARQAVDHSTVVASSCMSRSDPGKLLHSKWTAVAPIGKELHFVVTGMLPPRSPDRPSLQLELTAVYSGRIRIVDRSELNDRSLWHRGWR